MKHLLRAVCCLTLVLPLIAGADPDRDRYEQVRPEIAINSTAQSSQPGSAERALTISWRDREADRTLPHFASAVEPILAQAGYGKSRGRSAAQSDYGESVKAAIAQMEEERESSAIAVEREKAELASQTGLVYRNPEFWSNVGGPEARRIFEGEQVSPIIGMRYLSGWLAATAAYCSPSEKTAREIGWPDGPLIRQILADDAEADAFPDKPVLLVRASYTELFSMLAQPALLTADIVSQSKQSPALIARMAGPERDAARLMRLAGCNSATGKQFEMNLIRLLRGNASLQAAGMRLEQAREESDAHPN